MIHSSALPARSSPRASIMLVLWLTIAGSSWAGAAGDEVIVIYNRRMAESKTVAQYYALRREVPSQQIFGFDLPTSETITRADFRDELQLPLLKELEKARLLTFRSDIQPATSTAPGQVIHRVVASRIRYAVLCYGVPVRILRDTNLVEKGEDQVRVELRRNEAAVDSELALLPLLKQKYPLFGPVVNPLYGTTNAALINPANAVLMVARLDGPSSAVARGLVDKALEGETNGLWGRAYFDSRGLTNGNYKLGDEWIRNAAAITRRRGFETILDEKPETFPVAFPLSQVALYAGWYDGQVSGPFTRPTVEFMPGAFAYHLHSFSANNVRSANQNWVGPLLEKGATATLGCVDEPYLEGTPNMAIFFAAFLGGFSFGEAAYTCQETLSWQTTVIGDPLYRPFGLPPQQQHARLAARKSKLIEWSELKAINLNLLNGMPMSEVISYAERFEDVRDSAVLQEKLGDLYLLQDRKPDAIRAYSRALTLKPTPQQRVRLTLALSQRLQQDGQEARNYELLRQFSTEVPDYPDLLPIYRQLAALAPRHGQPGELEKWREAMGRLKP